MSATGLRYPTVTRLTEPDKPAVVMAGSGQTMTFAQLDDFAWRAARTFANWACSPVITSRS